MTVWWISSIASAHLVRATERACGDARWLVERFALPAQPRYELRMPVGTLVDAWEAAIEAAGERGLPALGATRTAQDELSWIGFGVANLPRLGDGLAFAARYFPTVSNAYSWRLEVGADVRLACSPPGPIDRLGWRAYVEFETCDIVAILARLTGGATRPRAVRFLHAAPAPAGVRRMTEVLGVEPAFAAPRTEVVFEATCLDARLDGARPELAMIVERKLAQLLDADQRGASTETRVRALLPELVPAGRTSVEAIARAMYMSQRSLERALAAEGTSVSALLDDHRLRHATSWLATLSVAEVAERLGYSDVRAFARAFKRWTGSPPSAARGAALSRGRRGTSAPAPPRPGRSRR